MKNKVIFFNTKVVIPNQNLYTVCIICLCAFITLGVLFSKPIHKFHYSICNNQQNLNVADQALSNGEAKPPKNATKYLKLKGKLMVRNQEFKQFELMIPKRSVCRPCFTMAIKFYTHLMLNNHIHLKSHPIYFIGVGEFKMKQ